MISRLRRTAALAAVLAGSALLTAGCQKVPLLAPSGSTITLTASATALPVNGSTDIIAQVIEAGGTPPHSGTRVTFTTNLGSVQPPEAKTDVGGRVVVQYVAGSGSGTATVTAMSGGVSASGTNAIKIAVGSAAVGGIALSASPTTLPASGGTTTIAAIVNDSGGNPLPSVPVTFSTDNGSLGTSVVTTDAGGRAQTTLTTSRTAKVTATAGVATTSGTTTTAASTSTVTVIVNSSATVSFGTFSPATPVAGQPVSFTLTITPSTTGAVIRNVVVAFGDGRSQTLGAVSGATSLSHTYDSPGAYTLTATATDSNGDAFPAVAAITVGNRPPANVTIVANPTAPLVGQQVAFTITTTFPSTNTGLVQNVTIDFGDGSSAQLGAQSTAIAQHVFQTAGSYTATAVVRDTNGGSTASQTQLTVGNRPPPNVTITASPTAPLVGQPVAFTITTTFPSTNTSVVQSVSIDFGDGSSAQPGAQSTAVAQHVYQTAGAYTAAATVRDTNGGSTSSQTQVIVGPRAQLLVTISSTTTAPTTGTSTSFAIGATPSSGSAISSIAVDFGDGSKQTFSGNTTSVQHVYTAAGTYTVTATAIDSSSASGSASMVVAVTATQLARPTVSISGPAAQPTTGSVTTLTITATAASGSTIKNVTVDFGDGSSSDLGSQSGTSILAQHIYQSANTYRVTVTVQDTNGSSNSASTLVVVGARQPLGVSITSTQSTSGGTTVVTFTATVTPVTGGPTIGRYDWNFGDTLSQTTTGNVVTHSYFVSGAKTITLTVTSTDGQTATNTTVIVVP